MLVIYFIGTTFFTQITILNMLIAIMSSTFSKHSRNLAELGKRLKFDLMADYLAVVDFIQKYLCCCFKEKKNVTRNNSNSYLFMITPLDEVENEENSGGQEGGVEVSSVKRIIDKNFKAIENLIIRQAQKGDK